MPLRRTLRVVVALAIGLSLGAALSHFSPPGARLLADGLSPVGTIWLNGLRMVVLPLVVGLIVSGVAGTSDSKRTGTLGVWTIAMFAGLVAVIAATCAALAPHLFVDLSIGTRDALPAVSAAMPAGTVVPPPREWFVALVPANPFRAAAEGTLLPLVVFSLTFAFALARVPPERRAVVIGFFRAVAEAMMTIVGWLIAAAPIGVFALAVGLGVRFGAGAVLAVVDYMAVVSGLSIAFTAGLMLAAATWGGAGIREFARAIFPGQVVAFTTGSSLAALPCLLEGAARLPRLHAETRDVVVPLAASTFKPSVAIVMTVGGCFLGRLYGVPLGSSQMATLALGALALSPSLPGIPGGTTILLFAPFYSAVGLPLEGIPFLVAIDAIPDLFRATLNATANVAVATLVERRVSGAEVHRGIEPKRGVGRTSLTLEETL